MIDMDTKKITDEYLMTAYSRTLDGRVFENLVMRYTSSAFAIAQTIVRKRSIAEDCVQEAFMEVFKNRERYDSDKPFAGWFFTILRNKCIDTLRKENRNRQAMIQIAANVKPYHHDTPEDGALSILSTLDENHRAVLILRIVHSMPFADVARTLGISEEAARKRSQRALARLRDIMCEGPDAARNAV
jgi:RNA polymerase sigma-70 factor, ECF subfamily